MISHNKSLWHLGNEYESLVSQLYDPETGEVNEIVEAQLANLAPSIEEKCIAFARHLHRLEWEEKEIESRMEAYKKEIQRRREYLKKDMERCNISEIRCPYFTLKIKKNPYSTEILDEKMIPDEFMVEREIVKVERKPDKESIKKKVLENGMQVPGAHVAQKTVLKISVDKL